MHQLLQTEYTAHMKNLRRRSFLKGFIRIMSCIVVFCTTYALILPAITMENKTFCGLQEHEHSELCYKNTAHRTLECSYERLGVHQHGPECYDDDQLICDRVDYVLHTHNQDCYDVNGYLICVLEEHFAHVHDDTCYGVSDDEPVLHQHAASCFVSEKGDLICQIEESEGHEHSASCYAASEELQCTVVEHHVHGQSCYEYPLVCDLPEEPHIHTEVCFQQGNCICTAGEDHTHDRNCFEWIQVCSLEEGSAHEHHADCYAAEPVLICSIAENHVHDNSCYKQVLQCAIEETSGHTHTDDCYEWAESVICGLEENQPEPMPAVLICEEPDVESHIHGKSCFAATEPEYVLLCTDLSEDHTHTHQCYELDCGMRTHKHSLACYSDPDADVETEEDWEADFTGIELTGYWPADVLTIAQTQLGYKESKKNYDVWPDDSMHGYTRYGEWYGIPYGDWCAMFVSFCLEYAEVEDMPHNACVIPWIEELTELKLYHEAAVYEPKPGDLIFYDWDDDGDADHVGFVYEIIPETEYEPAKIKALEGNSSNRVQYVYYEQDDEVILGYSELPENKELYICGNIGHSHNEYCVDDQNNPICELAEHVHEDACLAERHDHAVDTELVYHCGATEHTHTDDCYDEDGTLNCGAEEHIHTEVCVEEPVASVTVCEKEAHSHTEACYDAEGNLTCVIDEHAHDASCRQEETHESAEEPKVFYCNVAEHTHVDDCYNEDGTFNCSAEEHTHSESCTVEPAAPMIPCSREEHTHAESCYDEAGNVVCALDEHVHDASCADEAEEAPAENIQVFYCNLADHIHAEDCYDSEGTLICSLEEHNHTEECTTAPVADPVEESKVFYCGLDAHIHSDGCFGQDDNLICQLTEHDHSEECEIEPVIVYYCGREEHEHQNLCYGTEGIMNCPLKSHTHGEACLKAPEFLCGITAHVHSEQCYGEDGTLVCAVSEHVHTAVCEGYTCGLEKHCHGSLCYNEDSILVCRIPEHEHSYLCSHYTCGKAVHIHGHWCYDVNSNLACGYEAHKHDGSCLSFLLTYTDQNLTVRASITGCEWLPEDLGLSVIPITQETAPEQYASMQIAISDDLSASDQLVTEACFYDLQLISGGSVYTLPETATVTVTMEFTEPVFGAEDMMSADAKSYLLIPDATAPAADEAPEQAEEEQEQSLLDSLINAAAELFPSAAASELEDGITESGNYQASDITGDQDGLTSVTFQSNQLPSIGFALTRDASFSQYWERVESLDELKAGEQYMIVSAEGNYALLGVTGDNAVPVQLDPIEGHRKNYIITLNADDVTTANLLWTFTPSNGVYTIQNVGSSKTLYPNNNKRDKLFSSGNTCTLEQMDAENCWRIKGDGYYLRFHPSYSSTQFGSTNGNDNDIASQMYSGIDYYNSRDMLIFRMLPADSTFERPANYDSISTNVGSEDEENPLIHKPDDYGTFKDTSNGITGDTGIGSVSGNYYSDIATSQLEYHFRKEAYVYCGKSVHTHNEDCYNGKKLTCTTDEHTHTSDCLESKAGVTPVLIDEGALIYEMTEENDGMVRTDKSVIYGDDDYDAFSAYGANTFGITLSALGQAYPISSQYQVETPVDVVFVLDCSGSMSDEDYKVGNKRRIEVMVEALNGSIKSIMANPANRVGVVLYAQGANEVLPLGRYTERDNKYFTYKGEKAKVELSGYESGDNFYRVYTSNNLLTESGDTKYQNLGANTYQGLGTYTQAGIAMGSEVFHDIPASDTTFYQTFEDGTTIKTQRQPVFILLSDGEPTYSTSMYTDALNGVHYGDGMGTINKVKGIHGFYTILSANHYKRLVGIHYNRPALFFSIGLGLDETNSGTSADYKKAVLDPSKEYLDALKDDGDDYSVTSAQLLNLLAGNSGAQSLETNVYWPDDWVGIPHLYEPTMSNPFQNNYAYADESFFGNYSGQELLNKFDEILQKSLKNTEYGFVLMENTGVSMVDYIGAGMEIKGTPVLRYGGTNYTNPDVTTTTEVVKDSNGEDVTTTVRTYTYQGNFQDKHIPNDEIVDLTTIVVKVTDNLPVEHIYMCGNNLDEHTHTEDCGIYYTYLCGHHSHRLSCHEGNTLDGALICDDPHDHVAAGCEPVLTTQKVELIVPDSALPIYMPDLVSSNFYYEALPVRLIYQVGLTEDAEEAVAALAENGGELTFYTNRWGGSQHARSSLFPSESNPFYYDQVYTDPDTGETITKPKTYEPHTNYKGTNNTDTENFSVNCHEGSDLVQNEEQYHVYHELGNNGKLVFSVDTVDIAVEKVWSQGTPDADMPEAVEVKLYRVTPAEDGAIPKGMLVSTGSITPDADGAWNLTFTGVAKPAGDWYYVVVETPVDGFEAVYSGGDLVTFQVDDSTEMTGVKVSLAGDEGTNADGSVTITNNYQWLYELPKTGGTGTQLYIIGGLLLIAAAACLLYIQNRRRGEIL